jgi:tRNA pseudouridine55 synthase
VSGRRGGGVDGLLVVDKPAGMTSHDVVARVRRRFGQRRVGHAGTLDPDATGVLLVGLGRVTRLLRFLSAAGKSYEGEVVLGVETSTQDAAGEVVARHDMAGVTVHDVRRAAAGLVGEISQVPPMVSAVKVGGRRLHALARAGLEVPRAPRRVRVERFDVAGVPGEPGVFRIWVDCSSGTYVRTLAADLGRALGGGAHLRSLRRTAVGPFTIAEARPWEEAPVLPPVEAMRGFPRVVVGDDEARAVATGRPLLRLGPGVVAVVGPAGDLLAVYDGGRASVVLAGGGGDGDDG